MSGVPYFKRSVSRNNLVLLIALLLLLAAALMRPVTLSAPVYRLQIAFDISQSMDVQDVAQDQTIQSRLEYAKSSARNLLHELPCGSQIGWSAFTGRRTLTLLTPLDVCEHFAGLLSSLEEINGSMRWSNGSIIGKGLHQIIRTVNDMEDKTAVVFFTDGHEAPPLEIGQRGMPNTDKFDVGGLIVGVGGTTPMPIPKTTADGQAAGFWQAGEVVQRVDLPAGSSHEELSSRHDEHLQKLARLAGLHYLPLLSDQALLDAIEDSALSESQPSKRDLRWLPAVIALLLLCWRFMPAWEDIRKLSHHKRAFSAPK